MNSTSDFKKFFQRVVGSERPPFPYQGRLAVEPWPQLLDVPTGLGKTAAVILAWLYKRLQGDPETGMRLVYCLPMRVLVEQTQRSAVQWCERAGPLFEEKGLATPTVHLMMGGDVDEEWENHPERPAILIGTQDMLLSRALNRGYAMSRYKWPVHYSLLNNDCLWVFDETQLVGVGIETSAQLQGLRDKLGTCGANRTLWMSATLGDRQIDTVDHRRPEAGFQVNQLSDIDLDTSIVRARVSARKHIGPVQDLLLDKESAKKGYIEQLSARALAEHQARGGLTLVILNRVARAQELYERLCAADERTERNTALIHSRFRPVDRGRNEGVLLGDEDRIVVATQAVEAGVDVSARTLITELAPWPSLVQRFGRCNRYGTENGSIFWIDVDTSDEKSGLALPYEVRDLEQARSLLKDLKEKTSDAGPESLRGLKYEAPPIVRPVIRRKDVLELFDTTPDLCGSDIDVSRYIRDGDDTDVQVYWREFNEEPTSQLAPPAREELCRVSLIAFREFSTKLDKARKSLESSSKKEDKQSARGLRVWVWDPLEKRWEARSRVHAGQVVLLHSRAGGYSSNTGWTGDPKHVVSSAEAPSTRTDTMGDDSYHGDQRTDIGRWVVLTDHLGHVRDEARHLAEVLNLENLAAVLAESGLWHDVGKAHVEFQQKLLGPLGAHEKPEGAGPWAKSNHRRSFKGARRYFRHELASALAWLSAYEGEDERFRDLVAYLVAAHHGKVRMSLRSFPGEDEPKEVGRLFARGVWDGECLPDFQLPDGRSFSGVNLDLSIMQLGEGSWLERMLALRDATDLGPFRLALLETVVRIADWRASDKEQKGQYDE